MPAAPRPRPAPLPRRRGAAWAAAVAGGAPLPACDSERCAVAEAGPTRGASAHRAGRRRPQRTRRRPLAPPLAASFRWQPFDRPLTVGAAMGRAARPGLGRQWPTGRRAPPQW
eukprot:scaffold28030_cov72-Phaeocystis_antarctica.AAC.2